MLQLLRNSQAQNTRLKLELKALESLLESAKFQLASTKEKVRKHLLMLFGSKAKVCHSGS